MVTVSTLCYRDGEVYPSPQRTTEIYIPVVRPQYVSTFDDLLDSADWIGNGFSMALVSGFSSLAIHSNHPYGTANEFIYMLRSPIRISAIDPSITFDEVVLIEEGTAVTYTDPLFFDYAIVEASNDGCTWVPLVQGYDSRDRGEWSAAYQAGLDAQGNSTTAGTSALLFRRTLSLVPFFEPGDVVFVRFRLYSDLAAVAWGWTIDNLSIQGGAASVDASGAITGVAATLRSIHPNPAVNHTSITYEMPHAAQMRITAYDLFGKQVAVIDEGTRTSGTHTVKWNTTTIPSGVYMVRLESEEYTATRSVVVRW
jgi:hypothetical protein